jgi:hypothetical protein
MHQAGHWKKKIGNMPKEIAIYLNLLYSRADTDHFFRRTLAKLLTDSAGDVTTSDENNQMEKSNDFNNRNNGNRHIYQKQIN